MCIHFLLELYMCNFELNSSAVGVCAFIQNQSFNFNVNKLAVVYNFIQQLNYLAVVESKKKLLGKGSHSINSLFMGIL